MKTFMKTLKRFYPDRSNPEEKFANETPEGVWLFVIFDSGGDGYVKMSYTDTRKVKPFPRIWGNGSNGVDVTCGKAESIKWSCIAPFDLAILLEENLTSILNNITYSKHSKFPVVFSLPAIPGLLKFTNVVIKCVDLLEEYNDA
jgi:hypothetical protein